MSDEELDDFRAIADAEGMWLGPFDRNDLFRLIRRQTEEGLRVRSSRASGLTFFFGNVDVPGRTVSAAHFDLHREAELNFNDTCFKKRVMAFRADVPDPPAVH